MDPYVNEEAMFERLEALQHAFEDSRLMAEGLRGWARRLRNLGARAWWLAGLGMRRAPRRRPVPTHHTSSEVRPVRTRREETAASDAA